MRIFDFLKMKKSLDIVDLLTNDHAEVNSLFKKIDKCGPRAVGKKARLFDEIRTELLAHAKAEAAVLYARLKKIKDTKEDALEGTQEHKIIEDVIGRLSDISPHEHELWDATIKVLKENVQHHVKEEEHEMFKKVDQHLEREEREELGKRFLQRKRLLLGYEEKPVSSSRRTKNKHSARAASARASISH